MSNQEGYNVPAVNPSDLEWFTSEASGDQGACVEVALLPAHVGGVFLRHTKERSTFYYFDRREWAAFLTGAKRGEFDLPGSTGSGRTHGGFLSRVLRAVRVLRGTA